MTIFTKTISVLTLGMSLLSVSSLMSTNVEANHENSYYGNYIVTTLKGVNLRDENCNRVSFVGYGVELGAGVNQNNKATINCKINGRNYKMVSAVLFAPGNEFIDIYVAQDFVSKIFTKDVLADENGYYTVNNPNGLNIRDNNCKKIKTVANGSKIMSIQDYSNLGGLKSSTCKVGNTYYAMYPVTGGYAASIFLK